MKTALAVLAIIAISLTTSGCETTRGGAAQYQLEMLEAYIDYNLGPEATPEERQQVINALRKSLNVPQKVIYTKR
jgi:hypothetical protein